MSLFDGRYITSLALLKPVKGIYVCPDEENYDQHQACIYHHQRIISLSKDRLAPYHLGLTNNIGSSFGFRRPHTNNEKKAMRRSEIWIAVRNGCRCKIDLECHEDCHFGAVYSNLGQYMSREICAYYPITPEYRRDHNGDKLMVNMPESQEHQVFDSKNPVHMYQLLGYIDANYFDVLDMLEEDAGMDPRLCKALRRLADMINDDPALIDIIPDYINQQHLHIPDCIPHAPIAVGVYMADRSGRGPAKRSNWHVFSNVHDFVKQLYLAAYRWPRAWDDDNNLDWMFEADWVLAEDEDELTKAMLEFQMGKTDCPCGYLSLCESLGWPENPKKVRKLYEQHEETSWPYCLQCIPMNCQGQRSILPYFPPLKHKEPHARRMLQEQQQQQQQAVQ